MKRLKIKGKQIRDQSHYQVPVMKEKDLKSKGKTLEVISLSLEDLNDCLKLDAIALKGLWSKTQWENELSDSQRICLGIFDSSKLIALTCGWIIVDELHLTAVAVHPNYRRRGVAQTILGNLFIKAIRKGCNQATLEVKSNEPAALALYKTCGFTTTGRRSNYYTNGSDALIQWKPLNLERENKEQNPS